MTYENIKRWNRPDHFIAFSEDWMYSNKCFVFLGQHRGSDRLTRSNFQSGLEAIGGQSETVHVVRESHWAVGWVEWIAIHESDSKALKTADEILGALYDYPVVDESHFSELEWSEVCEYWESMSLADRVDMLRECGLSIFAARRDCFPMDDCLYEKLAY